MQHVGETGKKSPAVKSCHKDPSSLTLDMSKLPRGEQRLDCPAYELRDCPFHMDDIESVSATVSMQNCQRTWACPFWVSPQKWVAPQLTSGEVDLIEVVGQWNDFGGDSAATNNYGSSEQRWGLADFGMYDTTWNLDFVSPGLKGTVGRVVMHVDDPKRGGGGFAEMELAGGRGGKPTRVLGGEYPEYFDDPQQFHGSGVQKYEDARVLRIREIVGGRFFEVLRILSTKKSRSSTSIALLRTYFQAASTYRAAVV